MVDVEGAMREIVFRLRDRTKIVGYEKWYTGCWNEDGYWIAKPQWLYSINGEEWSPSYIEHSHKDQFPEPELIEEAKMNESKKIKALEDLNTILKEKNKRLREDLRDMQEQRDNALEIAENAILELRRRG